MSKSKSLKLPNPKSDEWKDCEAFTLFAKKNKNENGWDIVLSYITKECVDIPEVVEDHFKISWREFKEKILGFKNEI